LDSELCVELSVKLYEACTSDSLLVELVDECSLELEFTSDSLMKFGESVVVVVVVLVVVIVVVVIVVVVVLTSVVIKGGP